MKKIKIEITPDTILERDSNQDFAKIDDEVVMLSKENGEYYALNEIGSRIWEIIEKPVKVKNVINILLEEFDVEEKTCMDQTILLLNELMNRSLLTIDEEIA